VSMYSLFNELKFTLSAVRSYLFKVNICIARYLIVFFNHFFLTITIFNNFYFGTDEMLMFLISLHYIIL